MKTVQKYGEGADHASPIEDSATTPPQSAENATPTVEPSYEQLVLPPNGFTFDELAAFGELSSEGKLIICTLLKSSKYAPDQLSRALDLLSRNPAINSLDNETLQLALVDPSALPPFALEEGVTLISKPITVNLPPFLRQQIRDVEHMKRLLAALNLVFYKFSRSEPGRKLLQNEDISQKMAYTALGICVERIVEDAARQLGTYQKLKGADIALNDAPSLVIEDSLTINPELINNDPQASTDVADLQTLVIQLQRIA